MNPAAAKTHPDHARIDAQIRAWIQRFVVDLNLCPFARQPFEAGRVVIRVSGADSEETLLEALYRELVWLESQPPGKAETTLLVVPETLAAFADYNDFLALADALLVQFGWDGRFQIASFHPHYQFAGTRPDDADNYTNRAPWPILHLLREDSVEWAVSRYPDSREIPERNMARMTEMGAQVLAQRLQSCFAEPGTPAGECPKGIIR